MKSVILVHNFGKFAPLHSSGDGVVGGGVGLDVVVPDSDVGDLLDQARIQLWALRQSVAGVGLQHEADVALGHGHRVAWN